MRRGKGGAGYNRKVLTFYRINFSYTPPYQVLCDGDIIHESLNNSLFIKQSLPTLLDASAYPVVTNCVIKDLRQRGPSHSNAALFAKRCTRVECVHEGVSNPVECIFKRLEKSPHGKLMVAVANGMLLRKIASTPGIPLISIQNKSKIFLRAPSKASLDTVQNSEKAKLKTFGDADRALLEQINAGEKSNKSEKIIKRRKKKAKGPNPLSIKRSVRKLGFQQSSHENAGSEEQLKPSKKIGETTKEERSRKSNNAVVTVDSKLKVVSGSRKATRKRKRSKGALGDKQMNGQSEGRKETSEKTVALPRKKRRRRQAKQAAAAPDKTKDSKENVPSQGDSAFENVISSERMAKSHSDLKIVLKKDVSGSDRHWSDGGGPLVKKKSSVQNAKGNSDVSTLHGQRKRPEETSQFVKSRENSKPAVKEMGRSAGKENPNRQRNPDNSTEDAGNQPLITDLGVDGKDSAADVEPFKRKKQRKNRRRRPQKMKTEDS